MMRHTLKGNAIMQSQAYSNLDTNDIMTVAETVRIIDAHGLDFRDFIREVYANQNGSYPMGLIECWLGY